MNISQIKKNDLVTVCITTFNRKDLVIKALGSVLKQSYVNIEVIIVDDCSTDGTKDVLSLRIDQRVKYIRHDVNKGLAAARNTAISIAKGKYFTFVDDDDEWEKNFVESFVEIAEKYDDTWCFCCGVKNNYNNIIPHLKFSLKSAIYQGYTPPVAAQFYYLSSVKEVGGYNEKIKSGVDHDLWLKLAYRNLNIVSLDRALSIPNKNLSQNRMTTSYFKRKTGIDKSLEIWKENIEKELGSEFFVHFKNEYAYALHKKFILLYSMERDWYGMMKIIFKVEDKVRLLGDICRKLCGSRNVTDNLFNPYAPENNG